MTQFKNIARRRTIGLGSVCLMALALALPACNSQAQPPANDATASAEAAPESVTDLKADPALVTGTLDNGLRYAILHNDTPPGQGALRVLFDAGSLAEADGTNGLAHYLEHMAFNGTTNVPEGEMIPMLERLGLSFGADTNASTSLEYTTYKLRLPKTTDEILDAAFMLMRETASEMVLDQDAITREKGIILSEKRLRDTVSYRAIEQRWRFTTQGSDVVDRLPIGTDEALDNIRAEDFRAFYDANYHPEKTIVAFVGDVDPADIEERIRDTFGDWTGATDPAPKGLPSPADIEPAQVMIHSEDGVAPSINLMAFRPYVDRPDTRAERNARTMRGIGFRMFNQRLRALSESDDRPFISAVSASNASFKVTEGATITAYGPPEDWDDALRALDTELRRVLQHGFDPVELDAEIRRNDAAYVASAEGADTRSTVTRRGGLVVSVLNSMVEDTVFTHPDQELERWNALKDTLDVDQINAAFRERWGAVEDLSVFIQLPDAEEVNATEEAVRTVLENSRSAPVSAPEPMADMSFAYTDHGTPGEIVSDDYVEAEGVRLVTFDNHVSLAIKQTDFQEDRVLVRVDFGDGYVSVPERNEGMRRLALAIMQKGGLEAHTPEELRLIMAGRLVATTAFYARDEEDTFFMNTLTVPEDLRLQLDMFAARLYATKFDEKTRINHINQLKAWYPRHDIDMEGVIAKHVNRLIHDDERFGFDREEQFYEPTMAEMEAWLRPQLETGPIGVTIVGDVDPDAVVEAVAATFGALPDRRPVDAPDPDHVANMRRVSFPAPSDEPVKFYHRGDDTQSQLRLYWPAGDGADPEYARRLSVLGGILRNRLVKEIREREATTYSPGAGSRASRVFDDFGYLLAIMSIKPEDIDRMSDIVRSIADDFANGNISEDEFQRALKPIVQRLDSTEETNVYWMNVLSAAHGGDGLDRHRTRREDFGSMSVEDVRSLAKTTLDNDRVLEVRILPSGLKE